MSHQCTALVVGCMDFRLHDALHTWAADQYGSYDLVHLAGGARTVIDDATQPTLLRQIELSITLHGATTVVLVSHMDCGAYGGSAAFDHDDQKERDTYAADLAKAAAVVTEHFPSVTVVTALEELDGSVSIISA